MVVDYEVVKKKARLAMSGKMNIIERSAFWFRYERNGHREEEQPVMKVPAPEPEFVKRQWDIVNQLRAEVRFLSSKVIEMRAKKNEQHRYNIYT